LSPLRGHHPAGARRLERLAIPLVERELPAEAGSVRALRHLVQALARAYGAGDDLADHIGLAVTEATTNVVQHAYAREDGGTVRFAADVEDDDLDVLVSDRGQGLGDRNAHGVGYGLALIAANAADFAVTEGRRGVDVWMRFALAG
jgi:anti-sigma regulatory factor (Ser/Thr protein kinase)